VWFFISDRIKLLAYRILDPAKTREDQAERHAVIGHK